MVLLVLKFKNAKMEKFGVFIASVVFAHKLLSGLVLSVLLLTLVQVVKSIMLGINAFVQVIIIGMEIVVFIPHVLGVKVGKELNVYALPIKTLMGICVFNVLMDKFGILMIKNVNVKMDINGILNIVKELMNVPETVFGILHMSNAFALKEAIGVDMHASLYHLVMEGNFGIQFFKNVYVVIPLSGTDRDVLFVEMVKYGILLLCNVSVHQEHL